MVYTFFIMVGAGDAPIFELECNSDTTREDRSQLKHFIIHAALDNIDELMWTTNNLYVFLFYFFNQPVQSGTRWSPPKNGGNL